MVMVQGQPHLLLVVAARHTVGRLAHLLHGRQQQSNQNRDDGDDDQQFDQRKPRAFAHGGDLLLFAYTRVKWYSRTICRVYSMR